MLEILVTLFLVALMFWVVFGLLPKLTKEYHKILDEQGKKKWESWLREQERAAEMAEDNGRSPYK